jgi:MFS family permease
VPIEAGQAAIIALWIIDRTGRRPLPVLSIMLALLAAFAVGLGPGVWVVMSEIFPTRVRGRAMSIATVIPWIACVALTMTFLSLAKAITISGAFWLYGFWCVVMYVIVWRFTPETKGKTLGRNGDSNK